MAVIVMAVLAGGGWAWSQGLVPDKFLPWKKGGTTAAAPPQTRGVPVLVATAVRKAMPLRVEALGTVEPMISVTIRTRVASRVDAVKFEDGAAVREGDVLFVLDSRDIDAQILQAEATLSRDKAQLEKAQRDVDRYSGLLARNAVSQVQVEDAKTTADVQKAVVQQDEANLQSLRVQRSYYEIKAPVTGRVGVAGVRPGAVIRVDDTMATVRQIKPIYVAFGVPERYLGELRATMGTSEVQFRLQGGDEQVTGGKVVALDNTVDPQTGTLMVRALFPNADERLWPGTLGDVTVTLRMEPNMVAVPAEAIQSGQNGTFVFVVENNTAAVVPVKISRTVDGQAVVTAGLKGGEVVVTEGQLALRSGTKVEVKSANGAVTAGS
ncbi:efflux RND transporter periplasmic adaptor subunit [Aquabacter sp. L1I39]|uniref:efflux RND transporter periplasmic adaptor subunit n=1 Tax=Aquabacter sp. L1I39 TaxID=2820278 RepID=UPI001ADD4660|nr:efflux RND transporter periplasmic adaptor subunit [Aquabacter sp. L1I39]QTL05416.1 efflux RND transporter periplasmic adaptor subunit [Aquabacter sp. L1I39]